MSDKVSGHCESKKCEKSMRTTSMRRCSLGFPGGGDRSKKPWRKSCTKYRRRNQTCVLESSGQSAGTLLLEPMFSGELQGRCAPRKRAEYHVLYS